MALIDHSALTMRLLPTLLEAGAIALRYRSSGISVEHKADLTPVTAADRQAEAVLLRALAEAAPGIPVIAEEQVSAGQIPKFDDLAFLVDALDGTREYVNGGDDFTVNIGLVDHGTPIFGLMLAPASGRIFATLGVHRAAESQIDPATLQREGGTVASTVKFEDITTTDPDQGRVRVLTSRSHLSPKTITYLERFQIGDQRGIGSSLKFGMMAAGEADLYVRFGPTSEWDTAAGHAILVAAGGEVTDVDGRPLRYLQRAGDFLNPPFVAWGRPSLRAARLNRAAAVKT